MRKNDLAILAFGKHVYDRIFLQGRDILAHKTALSSTFISLKCLYHTRKMGDPVFVC
jgi:hypothetical protein